VHKAFDSVAHTHTHTHTGCHAYSSTDRHQMVS
jgi:hypothetical protein